MAACLTVDYDGIVAVAYLLDSVLCLLLCVLTHLSSFSIWSEIILL